MDTKTTRSEELAACAQEKFLEGRGVLIIVENLPVPFDRRVWQEACTIRAAGAAVSIICPTGKGCEGRYEEINGIHIYRHPLPLDAKSAWGYFLEYSAAFFWQSWLAWKILFKHGFDVIQGCNPPDLIFLIAWQFRALGKRFIFDHHDINPELYEAKFGRRGTFWRVLTVLERLTFKTADVVISTNNSYRDIAHRRGGKRAQDTFVVRSGPDLSRLRHREPNLALKNGRGYLIGYVGVMGDQEGIDLLLESARYIVKDLGRRDIQFCLVGGGPSLEGLKHMADAMGLSNYVTFTGRAPDDVLFEVLSTSDICVNPDRVNAMNDLSTMNKILEYMAFAKPIVQFDVKEGRYSAGEASLYAAPNDPVDMARLILKLVADEDQRELMGAIGRERVQSRFSWPHQVPSLLAAYRHALASCSLPAPAAGPGDLQQEQAN